MNRRARVLLGLATAWPLAFGVAFFVLMFSPISPFEASTWRSNQVAVFFQRHLGSAVIVIFAFTAFLIVSLLVLYLIHLAKNTRVSQDMKMLWALALFGSSIIAMPIYWWLYVRGPAPAGVQTSLVNHS